MNLERNQAIETEKVGVSLRKLLKYMHVSENRFIRDFLNTGKVNIEYKIGRLISENNAQEIHLAIKDEEIPKEDLRGLLITPRKRE